MRLIQIKLAGFKSFTDPTTLHVSGQLVGVVGPNGCGKSNVIDAVRWVLGESSARQLRGENMQDVIFNGAATRRPAPRALVELVFDNSDHTLQGAWGQYAEVAIKRQLTRQGESSYFINNQQVRRKDITDLFLGTGVGARGYAVIEQGMISRIIEARPEELRAYIEEAAGVSKYKERRRETELRLKDTREHLQRLADIQTELARQTEKLSQQAQIAQQYSQLQNELTEQQNILDFTLWNKHLADADKAEQQYQFAQQQHAQLSEQQQKINTNIATIRQAEQQQQAELTAQSAQYAQIREQIARLEEQQRAFQAANARILQEKNIAQNHILQLKQQHQEIIQQLANERIALEESALALEERAISVQEAEANLPQWDTAQSQTACDVASQQETLARLQRELAVKQQQALHVQSALKNYEQRHEKLTAEFAALALPLPEHIAAAQSAVDAAEIALADAEQQQQSAEEQYQNVQAAFQSAQQRAQQSRENLALLQTQIAAMQQFLATQNNAHSPDNAPTVAQHIQVSNEWRHAVGIALGRKIYARMLPENSENIPENSGAVWVNSVSSNLKTAPKENALIHHVRVSDEFADALKIWLDGVLCAPDLDFALVHQSELAMHECYFTPEGHCVDAASVARFAPNDAATALQQQAQLSAWQAQVFELSPLNDAAQNELNTQKNQFDAVKIAIQNAQNHYHKCFVARQQAQTTLNELLAKFNQGQLRAEHINQELQQIELEQHNQSQIQQNLSADMITLSQSVNELKTQCEQLAGSLKTQQQAFKQAQLFVLESNRQYGAAQLAHSKQQQKIEQLNTQAAANLAQQQEWQLRAEEATLSAENDDAAQEIAKTLLIAQENAVVIQEKIEQIQSVLSQTQEQGRAVYAQLQQAQTQLPQIQAAVQTALLQQQEALLNAQKYQDNLQNRGANTENLTAFSGSLNDLSAQIDRIQRKILALGAVNLAALQELDETRERQSYYTAQTTDVQAAMDVLQQAIAQIDDETKARFKETFDAANVKVQEFFPMLFGGGEAYLQMQGDDLLTAGVSIMARPIGKKNSSIHLLSGGEKALTAMSLVFALFSLNPAPFCLLDEVDAPLDDANTLRFCDLVRQMSAQTQFLYISHNRLTMEMANQLVGVTMQEKGVSRVVSVDIQSALKMAE